MIRACIFDLDGVLVDTAKYHYLAWKRLATELGIDLTETQNEKLKGVSRMQSLDIILSLGGVSLPAIEKEQMAARKNAWFNEFVEAMQPDEIFPGVKQVLTQLRKNGFKVALASSSKNANTILAVLGIEHEFDVVVDGTMIVHTKPDPEIFLLAAKMLNVPPAECLVFEDAASGVEAALRAGMKCIGIGSPEHLGGATQVVPAVCHFDYSQLHSL